MYRVIKTVYEDSTKNNNAVTLYKPGWKQYVYLSERLVSLGVILARFRHLLKPYKHHTTMVSRDLRGGGPKLGRNIEIIYRNYAEKWSIKKCQSGLSILKSSDKLLAGY